jgi:hypothetical protein
LQRAGVNRLKNGRPRKNEEEKNEDGEEENIKRKEQRRSV